MAPEKVLRARSYILNVRSLTSHTIVITSNYDCYMLYGKYAEPNKRRLDLHIVRVI